MKYYKTYSFASMTIRLVSDLAIEDTEYYSKFLSDKAPNITVNVICGALPTVDGNTVSRTDRKEVIKTDDGYCVFTSYFSTKDSKFTPYACKTVRNGSVELFIDYADGLWDKMIFNALDIPQMMIGFGSMLVHCSVVDHNGEAILFAGDSGAGKSTQAALWAESMNATVINGDRGAVCEENGNFLVYGVPFNGTSAICNNAVRKVKLLVLLEHGSDNELVKLDQISAFKNLLGKITFYEWDKQSVNNALNIVEKFVEKIPVFYYKCLPDKSAVEALEEGYEKYLSE